MDTEIYTLHVMYFLVSISKTEVNKILGWLKVEKKTLGYDLWLHNPTYIGRFEHLKI